LLKILNLVVVGIGALGSEVVKALGSLGPARVFLVDPDIVEPSNLTGSSFYDDTMLGQPKTECLLRMVRQRFPDTEWDAFHGEIADLGWGRLAGTDLIFGCVDRDSARLEMARISTRLGIPICDGGLGESRGRASFFPGNNGACFGCRLSASRRRELLSEWTSDAHPCWLSVPEPGRATPAAIRSITGGLQVELALRALADQSLDSFTTEIHVDLDQDAAPRFETLRIVQNEDCPFHQKRDSPLIPVENRFDERVRDGSTLSWEWPVCTRARCLACNHEWSPMVRKARLRSCPVCKSDAILLLECLNQIDSASKWAAVTPEDIGLPAHHLYTVWKDSI
jgi:molybdopterin/thiamine biosynthesis adenylyltransferase